LFNCTSIQLSSVFVLWQGTVPSQYSHFLECVPHLKWEFREP